MGIFTGNLRDFRKIPEISCPYKVSGAYEKGGVSTWYTGVTSLHTENYITIKGSFVLGGKGKAKATSLPDRFIKNPI